uniref:Uncharacterized protein n=1 Tax=Anguilla anguilla TaxID=7936 RepID=A0A0E9RZC3_ANGAN
MNWLFISVGLLCREKTPPMLMSPC